MQRLNDIVNERYNPKELNDNEAFNKRFEREPEAREDGENEALADELMVRLHSTNRLPLLAVGYSGIPRSTIDRHVVTARDKGRSPIKLFMHLIGREPLWQQYQRRKTKRHERVDES